MGNSENIVTRPAFEAELERLRDRVAVLADKVDVDDKPWYRRPDRVMSALALIVSILTFINGQYIEAHRSRQQQLRQVLSTLIDLRKETRLVQENPQYPNRVDELSRIADARFIFMEEAERMISGLWSSEISSAEYESLAYDEKYAGNYHTAENYYSLGLDRAGEVPGDQLTALQALAILYYEPPFHNAERGRSFFKQAALISFPWGPNPSDSGRLYEEWSRSEFDYGSRKEGLTKFQATVGYFCSLDATDPDRQLAMERLKQMAEANGLPADSAACKSGP